MGADRYNAKGSADALGKLIQGYEGQSISIERKNHDGMPQTRHIRHFALGIWTNIQSRKVAQTYTKAHEEQGFIQRFCNIILPEKPAGRTPGRLKNEGEVSGADFDFLDMTVKKLLELKIVPDSNGHLDVPQIPFSPEAKEVYDKWHAALTTRCNYGAMQSYIRRFDDQVLRMSMGFHYLHIAAGCVENGTDIREAEARSPQYIEKIDMLRAIAVSDIFLKKLDEFLWLWKKPEGMSKTRLNSEEESFAKHVIANSEFYRAPRSAREIIERGFATKKSGKELCAWLKKEGFRVDRSGRAHRELKFVLMGLEPWIEAVDLSRLAFTESPILPAVRTAYSIWNIIEASGYRMSVDEFSQYLNFGNESAPMISALCAKRKFMIDQYEEQLLFRKETFDVITRFLTEEDEMIDGHLVGKAA